MCFCAKTLPIKQPYNPNEPVVVWNNMPSLKVGKVFSASYTGK